MMIKASEFKEFIELVHSSKNHKDDWAITLYSKEKVGPSVSFPNGEPKQEQPEFRVKLVYCCSSFNLVFEKRFSEEEFSNENMEFKISELRAMSVVKEFERIKLDYSRQLVTVHDVHGDL
ncbi:hypothetical protein WJ0W_003536 [Paenibacillus melissococcoides]|uniref:Uncharacterized protein n=1 Tax=Paenibacillus melissococcoides TaxID=2912268 RepID=A0ABN8U5S8_9BACL|nr:MULTISPECIES: hypothetical protein [Paenibacillus]GIO82259.1 hypothetical protein J6TS7_58690 [Paenibacillus dendritiformis]CAH8246301.1 hypothetical protein WJ0W_003536 [Paenibacillus melissococcoides]CAH8713559.1 hypothetical protein WDD9_003608 [Paenibacillus melissococcoides]CAH8714292.1 hypothetical protein HTL2_003911 [Paenibacillus melissococcoides]